MNNIDFFSDLGKSVHPKAEEVSIVGSNVEENLFDCRDVPIEYISRFINEIGEKFSEGISINKLQQFSFQPADNISYFEDKLMAVFSGGKKDYAQYDIDLTNPHDDYCINYFLNSKKKVVKFYDLDVDRHEKPKLPEGSEIIYVWGLGVANNNRKDLYFFNKDTKLVSDFFKLPLPFREEIKDFCYDKTIPKAFGITYDIDTFDALKLKMYYYPRDPLMEWTVFDEVINEKS